MRSLLALGVFSLGLLAGTCSVMEDPEEYPSELTDTQTSTREDIATVELKEKKIREFCDALLEELKARGLQNSTVEIYTNGEGNLMAKIQTDATITLHIVDNPELPDLYSFEILFDGSKIRDGGVKLTSPNLIVDQVGEVCPGCLR